MRALAIQLNPIIGDVKNNLKQVLASIEKGKKEGADLIVFPELTLCGYPPEDLLFDGSLLKAMDEALEQIRKGSTGLLVVVGLARKSSGEKRLYNSAAIIADGRLLGYHDKCLLPTYDLFDEKRYFDAGDLPKLFEYKGLKFCVSICEDLWQHAAAVDETCYLRDPVKEMLLLKPELLINLSASPYHFDKPRYRALVISKSAATLNCPLLFCAQVGANDQVLFDGHSMAFNAKGELIGLAKGFETDELYLDLAAAQKSLKESFSEPMEELYKALVMGVRDYFHKLGFTKACLGLSGGIDSALVACIAVEALGKENVLLVTMPSRFSSDGSITDSMKLASKLGAECRILPIDTLFEKELDLLKPHFGATQPGLAEENLQARTRGMLLMALANKFNYLLLACSNKSELAMGYSTLYGDMCGAISPIGDLLKTQVYALANWINREEEVIPVAILTKEPSAELRPNQRDKDTLPDYALLDRVIAGAMQPYPEDAKEIATKRGIALELVIDILNKMKRAEYKRRQSAPSLRVSQRSFTVGRRYPIVQNLPS